MCEIILDRTHRIVRVYKNGKEFEIFNVVDPHTDIDAIYNGAITKYAGKHSRVHKTGDTTVIKTLPPFLRK